MKGRKAPVAKGAAAKEEAAYLPNGAGLGLRNRQFPLSGGSTMKLRLAAASLLVALATAACGSNPVAPTMQKDAPSAPAKDGSTGNWMGSGY